jgi:hypothetical protein
MHVYIYIYMYTSVLFIYSLQIFGYDSLWYNCRLHYLHILFSTAVFGIVYLPLSFSSLCALIQKRARIDRFDNSFILSKYFSCWNINLNLQ